MNRTKPLPQWAEKIVPVGNHRRPPPANRHYDAMTRKLDITAAQVAALCVGAKRAGYAPIVQIGNVFVRLVPLADALRLDARDEEPEEDFRL